MSRVLVVDDEPAIRKVVRDALEREGHDVETAVDGASALDLFGEASFELVITDLAMPNVDGLELVRRIRAGSDVPILVLTVRQEEREKVRLLDAGADDYVTKPFGVAELLARARALLRRSESRADTPSLWRWGSIEVDQDARTVRKSGAPIHLTPTEYSLLIALLSKPGAVWTHRQLLAAVWGTTAGVTNDTLRVHMGGLRRKLEDDPQRPKWFRTEPWVGYRFTPEEPTPP
jgi:two-component system KDP operon response regulator KdpE